MADDDETMTPTEDAKMEEEQEEKEETQPSDDDDEEEEDESDDEEDANDPTDSIAKARPKRSGAGSLMPTLLNAEAEKEANDDDQIALIFAEEEDDEDFDTAALEAAADAEVMSDSDDDENDQGVGQGQEEYEGEVELMKRDRAEKMAKKRKAHEGLKIMAMRKRARVEARGAAVAASAASAAAPRPKKKSERISWLPTPDEGPVRSSSRRQTVQNKEVTHARLKDSEEKRVRLIATMEEAARRKERSKPKEMTQEERLAEAAKTERLNSKALNRWEETERRKNEEQRARLEALQNRRLEGPVLSFWSGIAKWINGKLGWVGDFEVTQVPEKEPLKRKKANPESPKGSRSKKAEKSSAESKVVGPSPAPSGQSDTASKGQQDGAPVEPPQKQITFAPPQNPENFLDGIHLYASMPAEASQPTESTSTTTVPPSQAPPPESQSQPEEPQSQPQPEPKTQPESQPHPQPQTDQAPPVQMDIDQPAAAPPAPKIEELSTRNLIILENFETTTATEREQSETSVLFNGKKPPKLTKPPQEFCVITSQPARYRDPETGLPYANAYAYREIRRLLGNQFGWSSMLGCFVGPVGFGARGVPDRFLGDGEKGGTEKGEGEGEGEGVSV